MVGADINIRSDPTILYRSYQKHSVSPAILMQAALCRSRFTSQHRGVEFGNSSYKCVGWVERFKANFYQGQPLFRWGKDTRVSIDSETQRLNLNGDSVLGFTPAIVL